MDVRQSRWRLAVALICAMSLLLFQGCGKAPWRFEDMREVVDEIDPESLGEVVHDEESGTEYVGGEVAHRKIEILMVGSPRAVRAQVSDALEGAGFDERDSGRDPSLGEIGNGGWEQGTGEGGRATLALRAFLYEPGEAMPSGVVVPEPNLGVFLNMGY